MKPGVIQFIRFGITGVINTTIHGGALSLAVELLNTHPALGHFIAFMIANQFSYQMNARWTFSATIGLRHYIKFLSASLVSLVFTLIIAWAAEELDYHYLVGFAAIVILVPLLNFLVIKAWVFKPTDGNTQ